MSVRVLKVSGAGIEKALRASMDTLDMGGIVAYPTETFYALGVRYDDPVALNRLFELKGRPDWKSVALIIGSVEAADGIAYGINNITRFMMERYWPGPLTLLLPARVELPPMIVSEGRVAVRMPGASFALELAKSVGYPITATSANPSGALPPRTADEVMALFGGIGLDLLIDGGITPGGMPSTIIDATSGYLSIVREGAMEILPHG